MKPIYYVLKSFVDSNGEAVLNRKELIGTLEDKGIIKELESAIEGADSDSRIYCNTTFFKGGFDLEFPRISGGERWSVN